jgi:hypothetical protein
MAHQKAITSIAKAATLTATNVPLAGEVVAMALEAILDEKDKQLEQLEEIQADTQALLRGPYNSGMRWLEQAAAIHRSDEDRRHFIENARAKFIDAASQEHDLLHKALAEYQVGNCWTLLESNEDARVNFQRAHTLALEHLDEKKRALLARGREYSSKVEKKAMLGGWLGWIGGYVGAAFLMAIIGTSFLGPVGTVIGLLLATVLIALIWAIAMATGQVLVGSTVKGMSARSAQGAYDRDKNEFLKEASSVLGFVAGLEQLQEKTPKLALNFGEAAPTMPAVRESATYKITRVG